ncbi:MAG: hypothetical protein ACRDTJ_27160 [Pseudonocardiaceae bacterium]
MTPQHSNNLVNDPRALGVGELAEAFAEQVDGQPDHPIGEYHAVVGLGGIRSGPVSGAGLNLSGWKSARRPGVARMESGPSPSGLPR